LFAGIRWPLAGTRVKADYSECLTSELKKIGKASYSEDLEEILIRANDGYLMAARLDLLENAEEDTQTAGGYVLQILTVEYDILIRSKDRLDLFLRLGRNGGVESAFKEDYNLVILFFNSGFHIYY
jgi:hypothetical protein